MITVPELAAEALGDYLSEHLHRRFAATDAGLTEMIASVARLALECIGNSDALYHNVEHTMLVTLVGYDIMKGRSLITPTSADRLCPCHRRLPAARHRLCPRHPARATTPMAT